MEFYIENCRDYLGLEVLYTTADTTMFKFTGLDKNRPDRFCVCDIAIGLQLAGRIESITGNGAGSEKR